MSLDWTRYLVEAGGAFAPARIVEWRASRPEGLHASVTVQRAGGSSEWFFAICTTSRIQTSESRYRTADEAKTAANRAYWEWRADEYAKAKESGFAAEREAGAKAGAAFFAHVDSYDRASAAARTLRANVRTGKSESDAARAHCGVYASRAPRAAFAQAFREAFYAAMQSAMDSRLIRSAALSVVQSGSTESAEVERIAREWSPSYAATLAPRIAAEVSRLRNEESR